MDKPLAIALALLAASGLVADDSATVTVQGVTIIGFFPPYTQNELDHDDGSIGEGTAHVGFALEDLEKCLKQQEPQVRFELTKSLTLTDGAHVRRIAIPNEPGKTVGIVLAKPDAEPMVVYATVGPSSLQWLALDAAADYFGTPACKRADQ